MPAILRALLPIVDPYDWSRRLLPHVGHIEMTRLDANEFVTVREIARDRLQLAKAGVAGLVFAVAQVDIYDYESGRIFDPGMDRVLEETRRFFYGNEWLVLL